MVNSSFWVGEITCSFLVLLDFSDVSQFSKKEFENRKILSLKITNLVDGTSSGCWHFTYSQFTYSQTVRNQNLKYMSIHK